MNKLSDILDEFCEPIALPVILYHVADSPSLRYESEPLCGTKETKQTYLVRASNLAAKEVQVGYAANSTLCPDCANHPKLPMLILACVAMDPQPHTRSMSRSSSVAFNTQEEIDALTNNTGAFLSIKDPDK